MLKTWERGMERGDGKGMEERGWEGHGREKDKVPERSGEESLHHFPEIRASPEPKSCSFLP